MSFSSDNMTETDRSSWLLRYVRHRSFEQGIQFRNGWVKMDDVLTAYRHMRSRDSRHGRRNDDSIRDEIMTLVGTWYHESSRRNGLPELPRFQVQRDSLGSEFIRATDRYDASPSPPLPSAAPPMPDLSRATDRYGSSDVASRLSRWLLWYVRHRSYEEGIQFQGGWVNMDAVLTAYERTHRDSRRGRRTDESIRGEIMSLVRTEYHKSRRRDGLRELPRFEVKYDSRVTVFIRATDKDDSNPSPSLPTDATPERWFRAQIAEHMQTGFCGICYDPLASQNNVPVLVGCCLKTLHLRCLQGCIAQPHAKCPFCRHPLGNEPSEIEDPSEIAAEWSGLQDGFYSDSTSVSSEEHSDVHSVQHPLANHRTCTSCGEVRPLWPGTGAYQGSHFCNGCWHRWVMGNGQWAYQGSHF